MAKPVNRRQPIDQREDFSGDVLRELAVVVIQPSLHNSRMEGTSGGGGVL